MSYKNCLELECEITKVTLAIKTRNREIGKDLMANLRIHLTLPEFAGFMLICLERLLSLDTEAFIWAVEHLIPPEAMQEIHKLMSVAVYQYLIRQGLQPGRDFSVDAQGRLLLNTRTGALIPQT